MGEKTTISWLGSNGKTFSPWLGCSPASVGCTNCYGAAMAGRLGVKWGPNGTRRRTAESTWRQVERWNRKAEYDRDELRALLVDDQAGRSDPVEFSDDDFPINRPRVFPSLCDPFEDWGASPVLVRPGYTQSMDFVRRDFFALIDRCQNLDFLLLTKRPENVRRMWCGGSPPRYDDTGECINVQIDGMQAVDVYRQNVWLLFSASDQKSLEAGLPHLLACRDLVPVIGLSLEPLLGHVVAPAGIDWAIVGAESGRRVRPCHLGWIRAVVEQCRQGGIPCFVKQLGYRPVCQDAGGDRNNPDYSCMGWREVKAGLAIAHHAGYMHLKDKKGGDPAEWPEDLRVREFPKGSK